MKQGEKGFTVYDNFANKCAAQSASRVSNLTLSVATVDFAVNNLYVHYQGAQFLYKCSNHKQYLKRLRNVTLNRRIIFYKSQYNNFMTICLKTFYIRPCDT